jgi:hypothetical protein
MAEAKADVRGEGWPPRLAALVVLASVAVLLLSAAILVAHLNDRWQLDHTSGVWFALAWHAKNGHVYPEVHDGSLYGGTRYMPLYFLAHAGLARCTGEYLMAGKILSLLAGLACWALVFVALRQGGCPAPASLGLTATFAASSIGLFSAATVRGDLLPVVWQLAALVVVAGGTGSWRAALAGLLCALAVLTKVTAGWAALAILCWYFANDRRAGAVFLACWLGALGLALGALHLATSGRLLANFRAATDPAGPSLALFLKSPLRLVRFMATSDAVLQMLTPFALLECVRAAASRRWTVYHWATLFCLPVLLVIFADPGTASNHLVDLLALIVVLTGLLWASRGAWRGLADGLQAVLLAALLWGLASQAARSLGVEARALLATGRNLTRGPYRPLAEVVGDGPLLSEDPLVPVLRGQPPVLLDPYAFVYLARKQPERAEELARRIRAHEFRYIVLLRRLDSPGVDEEWYRVLLGPDVLKAIRASYRLQGEAEGYFVYVPRD